MLALALDDAQVGFVATVTLISQLVFAFFSGPIIDKIGRRKALPVFDFIAWCIPCIFWQQAKSIWYFLVAGLLNGVMQISANAWDCLFVEDTEKSKITGNHSLVVICWQLSVFFAPISAVLFSRFSLVPAIRILYLNAFVIMSLKIILLYKFSRETEMGKIRMEESRGKNIFKLAGGYGGVLKVFVKSRETIFALAITILVKIVAMINNTFWPVIVSKKLLVPDYFLPFFPIIKSGISIFFFLLIVPRLTKGLLKMPLLAGFGSFFIGQTVLIFAPVQYPVKYIVLFISFIFDAFGSAFLLMLSRSLVSLYVNELERARVHAILNMIILAATAPFGWIGGLLSGFSRDYPFMLSIFFLGTGFIVTLIAYSKKGLVNEESRRR